MSIAPLISPFDQDVIAPRSRPLSCGQPRAGFAHPLEWTSLLPALVPTGTFIIFQFADDVRDAYAKKLLMKSQRKAIVENVCGAGTNTPYLALRYILPTGWDDIYGRIFFISAFQILRPYRTVL